MSFATSLSAFGIKPATTGTTSAFGQPQAQTAPTGGIFGQPSQQQTTSAFGSTATQPATSAFGSSTGGGLFGNNNNATQNQPVAGPSLFGNTQQNQPAASVFGGGTNNQQQQQGQTGTSIFGTANNQQQQGQIGMSIFGAANSQQNQPAPGGGLFGNTNNTQTGSSSLFGNTGGQQQQNQATGSNLFGNTQQNQLQAGSSLFGNTAGQQQNQGGLSLGQNTGGSSLFGNTQNQPAGGSGLFGNIQNKGPGLFGGGGGLFGGNQQQQQTQPQGGGLFGGSTTGATGGSSLFGQPGGLGAIAQTQQQSVPFTKTTKFNDLPESTQKIFEQIDAHIQGRIQISKDLSARALDEEPKKAAETIRRVHVELANVLSTLQNDQAIVDEIKAKTDQSHQDAFIATRIMDGFRNPQQNGAYLKNHANFPIEFFVRAAEEIREKLQWYKATIEQIERRLVSAQNQSQYNPQAIVLTLQAQNQIFVALAAKTAELESQLQKLKSQYRDLWRSHNNNSARDPFNELDRRPGDAGILNGFGSLHLSR